MEKAVTETIKTGYSTYFRSYGASWGKARDTQGGVLR